MVFNLTPSYPANGNLRLYNMFPYRLYESGELGIDGMIRYIPEVASMNYNAIWINPLQLAGTLKHPHPDGKSEVSGSLYAMADEHAFNPLIFPGCQTQKECEGKLRQWTATARFHGLFPLFDLVLNHVGINDPQSPLQKKLASERLLLDEINERWPDIQGIDYYREGSKSRGLNTEPQDLDYEKIDRVFTLLWEPMIRRYICDYGFMGVRVDALTHIPVPVQQRAYNLIKQLVRDVYHTDALIVGELMVSNPVSFHESLSVCGLTHCLNPNSFFWSQETEGGYTNDTEYSPFYKQSRQLAEVVLSREDRKLADFKNLLILNQEIDALKKHQKDTIYIYKQGGTFYLALNERSRDICFNTATTLPVASIEGLEEKIGAYHQAKDSQAKRAIKKEMTGLIYSSGLLQTLYDDNTPQANKGGLVGVVGNHDVGTLKAKVMLDLAYGLALARVNDSKNEKDHLDKEYREFKNVIKGVRDTDHLFHLLQQHFALSVEDKRTFLATLEMRMREKLFIQSLACTGGWYSLAGDEFGVCRKPEVFREFALGGNKAGFALSQPEGSEHDLRTFIAGINVVLSDLPPASYHDKTTLHYTLLQHEEAHGEPDLLFMVLRFSARTQRYYLIGFCNRFIQEHVLSEKISTAFAPQLKQLVNNCDIYILDAQGEVYQSIFNPDWQQTYSIGKNEQTDVDRDKTGSSRQNNASLTQTGFFAQQGKNTRDFYLDHVAMSKNDTETDPKDSPTK
ncbi:alpha-amylase [Legionella spiritensis]|nr:alpha-amylase [Legionella spiritensis]